MTFSTDLYLSCTFCLMSTNMSCVMSLSKYSDSCSVACSKSRWLSLVKKEQIWHFIHCHLYLIHQFNTLKENPIQLLPVVLVGCPTKWILKIQYKSDTFCLLLSFILLYLFSSNSYTLRIIAALVTERVSAKTFFFGFKMLDIFLKAILPYDLFFITMLQACKMHPR